jgi:RNA polymerase sigma-B factor
VFIPATSMSLDRAIYFIYLNLVMLTPPVANELKSESLQLLREYYKNPGSGIRNQLVELNFGLVRKEAHHWVNQCTESYEDLLQVGSLGLIRAIERFDMSKGNAFSSFAIPYIRGEIQHYLRDKGSPVRIPRRWQALQHQASNITRQLQVELHRQPTDTEVSALMRRCAMRMSDRLPWVTWFPIATTRASS